MPGGLRFTGQRQDSGMRKNQLWWFAIKEEKSRNF